MRPRFNKKAFALAKKNLEFLRSNFSDQQGNPYSDDFAPIRIIHVTIDSFSRRHFYRKLKKTVNFINSLNSGKEFRAFDFKIHNVKNSDSIKNQG
jgi:hypothetical protein